MSERRVEDRLDDLEQQVSVLMERMQATSAADPSNAKDWRKSVGMFNDRPAMREIDEEGERIRREGRERAASDGKYKKEDSVDKLG
ncbi:hypothetical protein Q31b_43060 [Novipirellula aureliae]|uniref:Uncharacterized protein n=1 Tax=Novipirellula aureliae TaxID=2527966 RepID=A0A5C6DL72_9BACT|nr:hypothetical protein [Novipirellula aureliae]TWU37518.1 hypothetical protein Q31b_43060 [Novipirellula aureliae]